jgi:ECF transporter S component (folate family)
VKKENNSKNLTQRNSLSEVLLCSVREFANVRTLTITGVFIAVYTVLELLAIDITPSNRINFAFIALTVIGLTGGPFVCFAAGAICDITGCLIGGDTMMPIFTVIGALQGLIYGLVLYQKSYTLSGSPYKNTAFYTRIIIARLLDVFIINLIINTYVLQKLGYIGVGKAYTVAVIGRISKNAIELAVDIPLLLIVMPAIYIAYNKLPARKSF